MATEFVITAEQNPEKFTDVVAKSDAVKYSFDFRPWAQDNSAVESVSWSTESGQAAVSGAALTGGVATALLTFAEAGRSMVKVNATAEDGEIFTAWLDVLAREPNDCADDYGF
jgi:hypothetical protein